MIEIQVGQQWKEIDEDDPQTYEVVEIVYPKRGGEPDHYVIHNILDTDDYGALGSCRVGMTFFEYATLVEAVA